MFGALDVGDGQQTAAAQPAQRLFQRGRLVTSEEQDLAAFDLGGILQPAHSEAAAVESFTAHHLVQDFAERVLAGNGLAVFPDSRGLSPAAMQALTRELKQFESIFLTPQDTHNAFSARVFTVEEELPFAGHPILGAAALLHQLHGGKSEAEWLLQLPEKQVRIVTRRHGKGLYAEMDQGPAEFGQVLDDAAADYFAAAFGSERDRRFAAQVVSTGLPYLLLPVTATGLATAKQRESLDDALAGIGAAFVFLMDVDAREGRTWDPLGVVEDVATGSAAGPLAAWRVVFSVLTRTSSGAGRSMAASSSSRSAPKRCLNSGRIQSGMLCLAAGGISG